MGDQERARGLSRLRRWRLLAASGGRQAGSRNRGVSCRGTRPQAAGGNGLVAAQGRASMGVRRWAHGRNKGGSAQGMGEWQAHGRNGWLRARACAPGGGRRRLVYVGCHSWETALIVQSFYATGLTEEFGSTLQKAHEFLKNAQVTQNLPNYKSYYRERTKGSWTLTNGENFWPIADTTAESLKAILLLSKINPDLVGDPIKEERLYDAVDCLLSYVNKDGTLSSAECKRTTSWVEFINPSESFRNIIVDYPYPECTSSLIQALILFRGICPMYRREEIEKIIKNGASFIEKTQRKDGSWYGSWAEYVDGGSPHAVNTAMAILALLYAGQIEHDPTPLYRAAKELINMQMETGEFPQQSIHSKIYVKGFIHSLFAAVWALCNLIITRNAMKYHD
ncbi:hypothetical protein C2845_PM16G02540 [Panicum miliaceum]|uniref:Squalene cyclase C-terminal domain-containing protein n=1 Tax=Panicum miliaceum TaxID=4540 RepID=A0A3L6PX30_PANMI|nr:hypothetical protein C2845_PM16G02540 [Panicum miliaceum]